jgi:hypothetical protein
MLKIVDLLPGIVRSSSLPVSVRLAGRLPLIFATLAGVYLLYALFAIWPAGLNHDSSPSPTQTDAASESVTAVPVIDYL